MRIFSPFISGMKRTRPFGGQATTRLFRGLYDVHWLLNTYLSVLGFDPPSMTKLDPGPSCWLEAFAGGWETMRWWCDSFFLIFTPTWGKKHPIWPIFSKGLKPPPSDGLVDYHVILGCWFPYWRAHVLKTTMMYHTRISYQLPCCK